ncbi:hypothetical protein J3Q64DRAFT_1836435 [Phycomyces blakesleeanus]|uniref:Uncharacterized protein n=2 Tax=Phycomyces blakesleeanus TaxID=4837 RepID=A0A162U1F3_PHYB8|nr:hypothetical protein PHYBLDRAFT_146017 [Phycomyces blakesleeanus NRRL 1555(-)]OAD72702.1 hypothetical protein PHYBLDRAFT_146017 [Phycomyces blakesleeanus NRRL 1555(-)]|eukprot:XP_018290742.1 hypothetical protein PHYBLDRAFT_146017 [Phycomyces blakesleeanus NRRL 1555(-)]
MLNTIRIVIREELTDIRTSVARIDENIANQQQFIRQTFNADGTSNVHRDVVKQSAIERRMTYLVSHPDDRGVRYISATMNEARMGFIPQGTNKTPNDGVEEVNWGKLNSQKKLYYSLRLEELIFNNYNFLLYECQDQWAASLLLQEVMKAERQTEKRRKERAAGPVQDNSANDSISEEESIVVMTLPRRPTRSRRT